MNEIEKRKDMAMSLMDMELIPDMDEKILAEEYNCKKFSFTDLAALVHELVGVPVLVQPVEALVQRQVGAELRKAGGAVLAAAGILAPGQKKNDHAKYGGKQDNRNCGVHEDPPEEFFLL